MNKFAKLSLVAMMAATTLAGCGSKDDGDSKKKDCPVKSALLRIPVVLMTTHSMRVHGKVLKSSQKTIISVRTASSIYNQKVMLTMNQT